MLSESARMSSWGEARYRIQAPNSRPRKITVIALDAGGADAVRRLAGDGWTHATFFTVGKPGELKTLDGGTTPVEQEVSLDGGTTTVEQEVSTADLVIMVAAAEGRAHVAEEIGRVCSDHRVSTTTLVVGAIDAADEALARTLAQVRPWSLMLVLATDAQFITDMMTALRA
jgi:hypothetical protein